MGEAHIRGSRPFQDEFQAGYYHGSCNEMAESASKQRSVDFIRNLKRNVVTLGPGRYKRRLD